MRPNTIQEYLKKADEMGFVATCEGLLFYKYNGKFMELAEEQKEEIVDETVVTEEVVVEEVKEEKVNEEPKTFLNENISKLIGQVRAVEKEGFTTDQAIEIVKMSYSM